MGQARDEAGNIWEVDEAGNPLRMIQPAQQGRIFSLPQSPKEVRQEARADEDQRLQREAAVRAERAADRADRTAQRQAAAAEKTANAAAKPTEYQAKSAGFLGRLMEAERMFQDVPEGSRDARTVPGQMFHDIMPGVENTFNTADRQKADQAARNFIAASLRQESGAAISAGEFTNQYRIFFPMPGDGPDVIRQKAEARRQAIEGFKIAAGPLADQVAAQPTQKADNEVPDPATGADLKPPPNDASPPDLPPENGGTVSATDGKHRITHDARMSAQIDAMVNAGASKGMIDTVLKRQNFPVVTPQEWSAIQTWRRQNPGKRYYGANLSRSDDLNFGQRVLANPYVAPAAAGAARYANAATAGLVGDLTGEEGQGALDAAGALHPDAAVLGDVAGGITGALGAEAAVAARAPEALARFAPAIADTLYGGALGFNTAQEGGGGLGALEGGLTMLGGGMLGRGIGKGIARTVRGPEGYLSGADKSILGTVKGDLSAIRPQLAEAQTLNLPLSIADADPRLRALAGAVTRKSVNARDQAERIFDPRAMGQADRAIDAIDTHLAPITDIAERGGQHIENARLASNPLYEAARAQAAPVDEEVAALLQTPAGQDALRRAQGIAGNEGRNPLAMGFDLNDQGEVVLREAPSFETLDLVKRGFDARLSEARNPMTGQLDLTGNPELAAIEGLRRRYVGRLDELNPAYPEARAAYATEAAKKDALDRGYKAPTTALPPRDLNRVVSSLKPDQLPEYQRGYATSLADTAERTRTASNPYSVLYGSPAQREKIGTVFPQGAPTFDRINDFEREMAKTRYEVMGGSPTAGRLQADEQMNGGLGTVALDLGSQLMTGGGIGAGSILNAVKKTLGDSLKLGIGKRAVKRADEIAPVLFETNPQAAAAYLDELLARAAARAARSKTAGQIGGGFGAGAFTPLLVGP